MKMEDRCVSCGTIIPEGQQVCRNCMKGGIGTMMRNGEGYPSPTEHEAIRNIEEEKNKYVEEVFDNIEKMLSLIGYELVGICIKDRRSR